MLYMQVYISWDQNPWSRNVLYDLGSEWDVKKVICIHISWNENLVATVEAFIYIHRFYLKPNKPWQERKIEIEQKHYHSPYMCINGKIKSHGANLEYRNHDEGGEKSLLELKQGSQAQPSFLDLKAHTSPSNLKVLSLWFLASLTYTFSPCSNKRGKGVCIGEGERSKRVKSA